MKKRNDITPAMLSAAAGLIRLNAEEMGECPEKAQEKMIEALVGHLMSPLEDGETRSLMIPMGGK